MILVQITWWKDEVCVGCDEVDIDSCKAAEEFIANEQSYIDTVSNPNYNRVHLLGDDLSISTI